VIEVAADGLERLEVYEDRLELNELVFTLEDLPEGGQPSHTEGAFRLHKSRAMIEEYLELLRSRPGFRPMRILELGIWNGGSTVLWFELFRPHTHVAVDIAEQVDDAPFHAYLESLGPDTGLTTFWSTDQSDKQRLQDIVAQSFDAPLDLVIDDASHLHAPTKASFEAVFPALRPGGLYVIEDWPWGQLAAYRDPSHPWSRETPLTEIVVDLVRALAGAPDVVRRVHVYYAFVAVERGAGTVDAVDFSLDELARRVR
jgi:cephalosporin hydroxylase